MKITCQSCQSKYTIADEKIQGKVAKIRCRKCGATVVVDGSHGAPGVDGGHGGAAPADAGAMPAGDARAWTVNVAEGDQRTMTLAEIVDAYGAGAINGETFLWAEGMADWAPLAEVSEIVAALGGGAPPAADEPPAPEPAPPAYEPPPIADPAPIAAAARPRGGSDLFGAGGNDPFGAAGNDPYGGASHDDEVATSAASPAFAAPAAAAPKPAGARDEHSVLFSLSALTASTGKGTGSSPTAASALSSASTSTSKVTEDSGLIDLNALAKAQAAQEAAHAAQAAPVVPAPFLFPAALGSVEPVASAVAAEPDKKASKMPIFIGGGIAVAGLAIALAFIATRKPDAPAAVPSATAAAAEPAPTASAAPTAEPTASAAPTASETAVPPSSVAAAPTTRKTTGGAPAKHTTTSKPTGGSAPATPPPASPPPKKSGGCGCAPADLQCQIRCSATGH